MSEDRADRMRLARETLWEVELVLARARAALNLELSEQSEYEVLAACLRGLTAGQDALEAFLPREPPPSEQWEFEKRKCYRQGLIKNQCKGRKPDGTWCRVAAKRGSLFCQHHQDQELSTLDDVLTSLPGFPED